MLRSVSRRSQLYSEAIVRECTSHMRPTLTHSKWRPAMRRRATMTAGLLILAVVGNSKAGIHVWPVNGHLYEPIALSTGITWTAANAAAVTINERVQGCTRFMVSPEIAAGDRRPPACLGWALAQPFRPHGAALANSKNGLGWREKRTHLRPTFGHAASCPTALSCRNS